MTQLCVPIFVHDPAQARGDARRAQQAGADLIELRIDPIAEQARGDASVLDALVALVRESPLPCIVTCRPAWEGGQDDGDDAGRIALLEHLGTRCAGHGPAYFDVELAAYQLSANLRQKVHLVADHPGQDPPRRREPGLILSSHDFEGRPPDLLRRVGDMADAEGCRVVKVAWHARSLRDNLEAFELLAAKHKPTIALCMGAFGLPSRVLAKKFGALLTFAALGDADATAPGQPTVQQLKTLYRWDHLGPDTKVYGVIGDPVGHSMSPAIHNAGFTATGYDGVYLPMRIPPEYEHFKATVDAWLNDPRLDFRGASVTIPHKQHLLRFVREQGGEVEPLAERIGAANTLHQRDDGALYAGNTDYAALLDAVCDALNEPRPSGSGPTPSSSPSQGSAPSRPRPIDREALAGKRVAVLGAGGAARAAVAGFSHCGAHVTVHNRTPANAQALADAFDAQHAPLDQVDLNTTDLLINCTPVGMHPNIDASPLDFEHRTSDLAHLLVFDTIYNPYETKLLRDAAAAGCGTIPGIEMFVRQAAAQYALWTGHDAPIDVFGQVVLDRMTG
jgi:3-dehydroquinate dehydratase/shikimate dehydrogenase